MIIKTIIKCVLSLIFTVTMISGLLLMITDVPETAPIWEVTKVNGGGVLMFCISLLILSIINREESEDDDYITRAL